MVDGKTYSRLNPMDSFEMSPLDPGKKKEAADRLTAEQTILTNATVRGYAFTHQLFLEFFIDDISEIEWNTACFDQLVLEATSKESIQALVSNHAKEHQQGQVAFDDIVKGKGQGLVFVLSGPPGVGK